MEISTLNSDCEGLNWYICIKQVTVRGWVASPALNNDIEGLERGFISKIDHKSGPDGCLLDISYEVINFNELHLKVNALQHNIWD